MNAAIHRRLTIIENKLRKCCGEELLPISDANEMMTPAPQPTSLDLFSPTTSQKKTKGKRRRRRGGKTRRQKGG